MNLYELFKNKNVYVRTLTFHYTGHVVSGDEHSLVLEEAAWIADSGRFGEALLSGMLNEVEPFPAGLVYVSAIVDVTEWRHELPRETR
jgi:hypothetical protein